MVTHRIASVILTAGALHRCADDPRREFDELLVRLGQPPRYSTSGEPAAGNPESGKKQDLQVRYPGG